MKDRLMHWLLNWPRPLYDTMLEDIRAMRKPSRWTRFRHWAVHALAGETGRCV